MPEGPKCEARPADVVGNAMHVVRIGTGDAEKGQEPETPATMPAAVSGRRGGAAPVEKPRPERRSERGPVDELKAVAEYL